MNERALGRWLSMAIAIVMVSSLAGAAPVSGPSALPSRQVLAVTNVTLLPMTRDLALTDQTVVVADGVITAVGPSDKVLIPADAQRIDGRGRWLMPGLADMHVHPFPHAREPGHGSTTDDAEDRLEMLAFLASGITTIRNMSGSPVALRWRREVERGAVPGPRMLIASPILEGDQAVWPWSTKIHDPREAEPMVAGFARAGYEYVKVYHTISAPVYRAVCAAARRHGLRVVGHVPFDVGIEGALAAGQYSIEHLRGYDFDRMPRTALVKEGGRSAERLSSLTRMSEARADELANRTVQAGTWNVATLGVHRFLSERERRTALTRDSNFALLPPRRQAQVARNMNDAIYSDSARAAMLSAFPAQRRLLARLHAAGAGVLAGTDSNVPYLVPGFTVIEEIGELTAGGISTIDALRIATVEAARFAAKPGQTGTVQIGQRTDMILLSADPLADTANLWKLDGVVVRGVWRPKADLLNQIRDLRAQLAAAGQEGAK